jgi:hypothetical protein
MTARAPVFMGVLVVGLLALATGAPQARAQEPVVTPSSVSPAASGPSEPGVVSLRAVRVAQPLSIDGELTEAFYTSTPAISGFVQTLPVEGAQPSERTEAWLAFDADNVYVSARVWDSADESAWVANEMRRDAASLEMNDQFGVFFDTYLDRRNGFGFWVNPLGGFSDAQITNEEDVNIDWNPVLEVRTGRFDGGWTVEMAIPFRSLRYRAGGDQVWGIQMRRGILRRNEWNHLTFLPYSVAGNGTRAAMRVSRYATLEGVEPPPSSVRLEAKPYGISGIETNRIVSPRVSNDAWADAGVDVKWGVTENLTADFTLNTDFAQVEVDEQQVNLTRFGTFFPEKRDFFLESQGIFEFGNGGRGPTSTGGGGPPGSESVSSRGRSRGGRSANQPTLFYSRRIGLQSGSPVPILGGGRVTGRVGAFNVGVVGIRTQRESTIGADPTTFSVLRVRRDVFGRSSVGALFGSRSQAVASPTGSNDMYGLDYNLNFLDNLQIFGYWADTNTDGITDHDYSYRVRAGWRGDKYSGSIDHVVVGDGFNPEIGFVRRSDFREVNAFTRFSPRMPGAIRRLSLVALLNYVDSERTHEIESRMQQARVEFEFENGDWLTINGTDNYERLTAPTSISGAMIPAGAYDTKDADATYYFGPSRRVSGSVSVTYGEFYSGHVTSLGLTQGRIEVLPQLSIDPSLELNWVDLPGLQTTKGQFDQHVARMRITYSLSPRAFVSALVQYNAGSDNFGSNVRFRWEWAPGSELFVVYTEDRDTDVLDRWSDLIGRQLVIKATRLFRF